MNAATRDHHHHPRVTPRLAAARINNILLAVAFAAIVLGLTVWHQERSERAFQEELATFMTLSETVTVSLADCPPPLDGDPGVLLFFITTRGDAGPRVEGCSRIAARPAQ